MSRPAAWIRYPVIFFVLALVVPYAWAQHLSSYDRELAESMWQSISKDVEKHYYDPSFHGMDWDATAAKTEQAIKESPSLNIAMAQIAQALVTLNDSHTFFLPPARPYILHYGFQYQMIGNRCYITHVRPGSDAETKGLKPGDELLALDGVRPTRDNLWMIEYRFNLLRPVGGLRLIIQNPQGQRRQVDARAKVKQTQRVQDITGEGIWALIRKNQSDAYYDRARWIVIRNDVMVLKFPAFSFDQWEVEDLIRHARKHSGLVLDLRGNPGGDVDTLKYLLGGVFSKDVEIAQRVGRKKYKPEIAKTMGSHAFTGKLVVLVDSGSASAAELFARVIQLQKRGEVIGDRTSGSVMEAKQYSYQLGADIRVFYGASITDADLIMSDGKSLEHTGVTPDEIVLPTGADLANGRDPVLARAAAVLGAKLTPEDAGKLFPYEWRKD